MDWVTGIDLSTLYALLAVASFVESIFPPAPADVVVAFASFLAARHQAQYWVVVAAIAGGNTIGSMAVYPVARHYGADWMHRQLRRLGLVGAEERLEAIYLHYGLAALFVSRFIPGMRAAVPPMAGALRVPWVRTAAIIGVASAIWYGTIAWVAFRVGNDWEHVQVTLKSVGREVVIVALVAAVLLGLVGRHLWIRHRAAKRRADDAQAEPTAADSATEPTDP
jgi:membrane protein DedA with SNARE-associated domain